MALTWMPSRNRTRFAKAVRLALCVIASAALLSCQQAESHASSQELLYILDSDWSRSDSHAQLLVVDPQRKVIVKKYQPANLFDFALSADGRRLFLAHGEGSPQGDGEQLDVMDTANGAVLATVSDPNPWVTMGPYRDSGMTLSADGRWLYVYKLTPGAEHTVSENVAIFDTSNNKFLPETVAMPECGGAILLPWPNGRALSVICGTTQELRTVQFNDQGVPLTPLPTSVSVPHDWGRRRVATAFVSGTNELTVLMTDGHYSRVNVQTGAMAQEGDIVFSPALTPAGWHPTTPGAEHVPSLGRRFIGSSVDKSQDRLYIPLCRSDLYMHAADALAVVNANTMQQENFFELKSSFWKPSWNLFKNATVGDNGNRLYLLGMEAKNGNVRVLSLPDGKEINRIEGIGATPTMLVRSP